MTTKSMRWTHLFAADLLLLTLVVFTAQYVKSSPWVDSAAMHSRTTSTRTPIDLGTTLVAIKYKHGVVLGADSRTSQSNYVSHRYATKWVPITDYCFVGRSGSASETQHLVQLLQRQVHIQFYRYGRILSPKQLAHYIASRIYNQDTASTQSSSSSDSTSVSLLVAGYDMESQSPCIYSIAPSGALIEEDSFGLAGSGSRYVMGFLDHYCHPSNPHNSISSNNDINNNKVHQDDNDSNINNKNHLPIPLVLWDEMDTIQICRQAVQLAVIRDGSSGGPIRIYSINQEGNREIDNPSTPIPIATITTTTPSTTTTSSMDKINHKSSKTIFIPGFANAEHG